MSVTIDTSQLEALAADVTRGGQRLGQKGAVVLRAGAFKMQSSMQQLAAVDTGNMRSSVSTSFAGDGRSGVMAAEIGPTADYSIWVETGTSTNAAQPFVGPAYDQNIGGLLDACAQLGDDLL